MKMSTADFWLSIKRKFNVMTYTFLLKGYSYVKGYYLRGII